MMDDYISREAAKTEFERYGAEDDAIAVLNSIPAADVRPVVRGRWKRRKNWSRCVCSACSFESDSEYHFCPNCGADMREEKQCMTN